MKTRTAVYAALAACLSLSAPLAFAQAAQQDTQASPPQAQGAAPMQSAPQQAQPTDAAAQPKKVTWSDLDADKDGKLTKTEASGVQALSQVFDDADADKDGALTPDEYKAFVAKNAPGAAPPAGSQGG